MGQGEGRVSAYSSRSGGGAVVLVRLLSSIYFHTSFQALYTYHVLALVTLGASSCKSHDDTLVECGHCSIVYILGWFDCVQTLPQLFASGPGLKTCQQSIIVQESQEWTHISGREQLQVVDGSIAGLVSE